MEEYHIGYLRTGNYEEKIIKKDGEYFFSAYANHIFDRYNKIDVYLKDGTFYKTIEEKNRVTREENLIIDKAKQVVQIDYNFYLLPVGYCSTLEEVNNIERLLINSFGGGFDVDYHDIDKFLNLYFSPKKAYNFIYDYFDSIKSPFEVCIYGSTRYVKKKQGKNFLTLDFKEYEKRKNQFKETIHKDYHDDVESIYQCNISVASLYYMNSRKALYDEKVRRVKMIEKLNYKINRKVTY